MRTIVIVSLGFFLLAPTLSFAGPPAKNAVAPKRVLSKRASVEAASDSNSRGIPSKEDVDNLILTFRYSLRDGLYENHSIKFKVGDWVKVIVPAAQVGAGKMIVTKAVHGDKFKVIQVQSPWVGVEVKNKHGETKYGWVYWRHVEKTTVPPVRPRRLAPGNKSRKPPPRRRNSLKGKGADSRKRTLSR